MSEQTKDNSHLLNLQKELRSELKPTFIEFYKDLNKGLSHELCFDGTEPNSFMHVYAVGSKHYGYEDPESNNGESYLPEGVEFVSYNGYIGSKQYGEDIRETESFTVKYKDEEFIIEAGVEWRRDEELSSSIDVASVLSVTIDKITPSASLSNELDDLIESLKSKQSIEILYGKLRQL